MAVLRLNRMYSNAGLIQALSCLTFGEARSVLRAFRNIELDEPDLEDQEFLHRARSTFIDQIDDVEMALGWDTADLATKWSRYCALRYLDAYLLPVFLWKSELLANTDFVRGLISDPSGDDRVILVPFHMYETEYLSALVGRYVPITQLAISSAKASSILAQADFGDLDLRFIETSSPLSLIRAERSLTSRRILAASLDVYSGSRDSAAEVQFLGKSVYVGGRGFNFLIRKPGTRVVACTIRYSEPDGRYIFCPHLDRQVDGSPESIERLLADVFQHLEYLVLKSPSSWYGWERFDQLGASVGSTLESGKIDVAAEGCFDERV